MKRDPSLGDDPDSPNDGSRNRRPPRTSVSRNSMDEFHVNVYNTVRQIPTGKVTTYGHIAKLVGKPTYSRHVGQALKWLSPNIDPPVPWQRVIASSGAISSRGPGTDGAQRQRNALEAEGVEVTDGRAGEMRVDLRTYGWFPNALEGQAGNERDGDM